MLMVFIISFSYYIEYLTKQNREGTLLWILTFRHQFAMNIFKTYWQWHFIFLELDLVICVALMSYNHLVLHPFWYYVIFTLLP